MSRVATIFTVERIAHQGIGVVFNHVSTRLATRAALLLLVKLEGFMKRGSEPIGSVLCRRTLGNQLVGPFDINDGVPEVY